ncbi:hypothetical protein CMI37_10145 [Candidatus Pacearchaeota archaeon]|nr:hypothetical protein [Candidatus Pacearchaeota archaeon]|tara:strand:- start:67 stop:1143 length:1077 start_codon:yes stop_codon:yes gene_type:complete
MAIQVAKTLEGSGTRKRVIYQSEALFSGSNNIQRVQSVNYSFTVPRTDVNQYGQLGQIERIITEVPTVSLDFTYHLNGVTNETHLLANGALGASYGFMRDLNRPASNVYEQQFTVGLSNEGIDFNNGSTHTTNKGIIIPKGFLTSYSWTGAVGDVPSASVNAESTQFEVGTVTQNAVAGLNTNVPVVLRPGNVGFKSAPMVPGSATTPDANADLPVLGFDIIHVQSFTTSIDIPRESIQRLGDKFEFARVITFPIQATMSIEGIVSQQAASKLEDIVGTNLTDSTDPGFAIDVECNKANADSAVNGISLMFRDAKIEGHSVSSSIGANKSITLDYSVQVDGGGTGVGAAKNGFFMKAI